MPIKISCKCDQFTGFDPATSHPRGRDEFAHYVNHGPIQYPSSEIQKCLPINGRKFQHNWFKRFDWLEFSTKKNAAFCFYCRLFASETSFSEIGGHADSAFTTNGYSNWKKATEKNKGLQQHELSKAHLDAEQAYLSFLSKPVDAQISSHADAALTARQERIGKNRKALARIFNVIRFLLRLGLPLRGHDETAASLNKGVFREVLKELAENGDETLKNHLENAPANANYLSPRSQNEMIEIIGAKIAQIVANRARDAEYFAVLMDETQDLSHQEPVAIVLRYVHIVDGAEKVEESLLAVVKTDSCSGEPLSKLLSQALINAGLDVKCMVAQGYDGASAMTSEEVGVQARMKVLNPSSLFVLCYCHSLNRVLVNSLNHSSLPEPKRFFDTFELLITFLNASPYRVQYFLNAQGSGAVAAGKGMSDTRWSSRSDSLNRYSEPKVLKAAFDTLEHVIETTSDSRSRAIVLGILRSVKDFTFVLMLCAFHPVMSVVNVTSKYLQSPEVDILDAINRVKCLKEEIQRLRSDEKWEDIKKTAELALATGVKIEVTEERRRKVSRRDKNPETAVEFTREESVRVGTYFLALDKMMSELDDRFSDELGEFAYLQHAHMFDADAESKVEKRASCYEGINVPLAVSQFRLFRQQVKGEVGLRIVELQNKVPSDFVELKKLYRILLTIPVTTAGVERVFSKLLLVKSKLRTTMTQTRLESLLLAVCEKEILLELKDEDLVAAFCLNKDRRLELGY